METLILQLAQVFTPIVMDIVRKHQAAHNGELPTDETVHTELTANLAKYLEEGSAWKATHPNV